MNSVWQNTSMLPSFDSLKGDIKTDVLIIGGGMAGILCAHMLSEANIDYILLEASTICGGITKNTTAKITAQHGAIYSELIKNFGIEKARMYLEANQAAVSTYRKLCANIDCDFEEKDAYVYTLNDRKKIKDEVRALWKLGVDAKYCEKLPLPLPILSAEKFEGSAQFNPLKFVEHIARPLKIFEHTPVREMVGECAVTDRGIVSAQAVVVATHFPFINKHGSYFLKLYQHRSYVAAFENAQNYNGMYVDESGNGMSFRNYRELLLIGGGGHRTGKRSGAFDELRSFARINFPTAKEKFCWATQDCMSLDSVPYIGRYSKRTPNLYVATGFNKWGMTSSMVAASIIKDMVMGRDNPYEPVFSPSRSILTPQLFLNAAESAVNLLSISQRRCPHMGCALKWNRDERTWDCPCHGSRFSEDGELIDNPATGNLRNH